jgi:hypothetical protein
MPKKIADRLHSAAFCFARLIGSAKKSMPVTL